MDQYKDLHIVNLHCHSLYSCLDGFSTIEEIVGKSKEYGFAAASITDHGCIDGCVPLYQECQKQGIKPILGEEFYICPEGKSLHQKDNDNRKRHHLIIVAKNEIGYRNLTKLSSIAFIEGRYYKPRIDLETLFKYKEGLIVSSACYASQLSYYLAEDGYKKDTGQDGYEKAKSYCLMMQQEFGDDFYIEEVWLRPSGKKNPADGDKKPIYERQEYVNARATQLSKELGIKRIMTIDSHYTNKEDQEAHEVLVSVGTASDLNDPGRLSFVDIYEYIPTPEDMIDHAINDLNDPDLVVNLEEIVNKVDIKLSFIGKYHIPKFPCPKEFEDKYKESSEKEYLRHLVFQRIKEINYKNYNDTGVLPKEIVDRLKMELDTIDKMGYNGYHLIVRDYVLWAKENGVIVGPGRGSCISSLVCYLLGITSIDPMDYTDLMVFSRYLNPERASMPDIDMDFSDRQKVEDYFCEKWGKDKTAAIQTNLYMRAKNAFKDVARTLNYSYMDSQKIANMIPDIGGGGRKEKRIPSLLTENEDIKKSIQDDPKLKEVFKYAEKLEGTVRGHGVHACGVVVAPEPLNNYMGLATAQGDENRVVTQASPDDIEGTFGLLKMDLLGLSNLTILDEAIRNVKRDLGIEINLEELPQNDEDTYHTYSSGNSFFTFQTNTAYVRGICKEYKPKNLRDLAWIVAVCRPGPMAFIPELIKVRNGEIKPTYICEAAKEIFEPLGGKPIFQESVMLFSMKACGFSQGQADILRKAMAKTNNPASLESHKQEFIEGYLKTTNPNQEKEIEQFWNDLAGFARYSFNACLRGDTKIELPSQTKSSTKYTIADYYRIWKSDPKDLATNKEKQLHFKLLRNKEKGYLLEGLSKDSDNRIRNNKLVDIRETPEQNVYRLTLKNGLYVDCTETHTIPTLDGVKMLCELKEGDLVFCKGKYDHQSRRHLFNKNKLKESTKTFWAENIEKGKQGFQKIDYDIKKFKTNLFEKVTTACKLNHEPCYECHKAYNKDEKFELHHIDGDHNHDSMDNFKWLCNSCHKKAHYDLLQRKKRFEKGILLDVSEAVSIEFIGKEKCYDVEMADPSHNVVLENGMIVGNSHSVGYCLISYWTCYMLTHYPEHYLAAYMNAKKEDKDELAEIFAYCKKNKIKITPPDVTNPGKGFVGNKFNHTISYGLSAIKGIGSSAETIIKVMKKENHPKDLEGFLLSFNRKELNSGKIKSLIYSGALDNISGVSRRVLIENIDTITDFRDKNITNTGKKELPPMLELLGFSNPKLELKPVEEIQDAKDRIRERIRILDLEKEHLGSYITANPLKMFEQRNPGWVDQWRESQKERYPGTIRELIGRLIKKHQIITKKGDQMAFLTFEVMSGVDTITLEVTVFPDKYKNLKKSLDDKAFYRMSVKPEKDGIWRAIAQDIAALDI